MFKQKYNQHREHMDGRGIWLLSLLAFFMAFGSALLSYIFSDYFQLSSGLKTGVGVFFFVVNVLDLVVFLNFHSVINRYGKSLVLFVTLFSKIVLATVLSLLNPSWVTVVVTIGLMVVMDAGWIEMDDLLEEYSVDNMSGRVRGMYLTIANLGFLLGPLVATQAISKNGFHSAFMLFAVASTVVLAVAILTVRKNDQGKKKVLNIRDLLANAFSRMDVLKIYSISLVLELFYALMVIYVPLYFLRIGFSWAQIGYMFTIMLVPFVIFQYPAGFLADKKYGEKELLAVGLFLMGVTSMSMFFVETRDILIWSVLLFFSRVGASLVEVLRDSFFYKQIDGRDIELIHFFRTARPTGYILATLIALVFLAVWPLKGVFLMAGIVSFLGLVPTLFLVDSRSERERLGLGKSPQKC